MTTRALWPAAAAFLTLAAFAGPAAAQPIDCANPSCEAKLSDACLSRLGAGSIAAGDGCDAEQEAYVACLTEVAETCAAAPQADGAMAACAPEDARQMLAILMEESATPSELEAFAEDCAGTPQANLAALRAERLRTAAEAAPAPPPAAAPRPAPRLPIPPRPIGPAVTADAPPVSSPDEAAAPPELFEAEWRLVAVHGRGGRCTAFYRLRRDGDDWRWDWKGRAGMGYLKIRAPGFYEGGRLYFSNNRTFRIGGGRLIHESPNSVCSFERVIGGTVADDSAFLGDWTLDDPDASAACAPAIRLEKDRRALTLSSLRGGAPRELRDDGRLRDGRLCFEVGADACGTGYQFEGERLTTLPGGPACAYRRAE